MWLKKNLGNIIFSVVVFFISLEFGSYFVLRIKNRIGSGSTVSYFDAATLDPYERIDSDDPAIFSLVPLFKANYRELIEAKSKGGHWFGERLFRQWIVDYSISPDDTAILINSYGFRGPEVDIKKKNGIKRIITIGDSCTFGAIEPMSYPRTLERTLNKQRFRVEVINAGVEGYTPGILLKRLDHYLKFNPDVVTVYIGWNAIHDDWKGIKDVCSYFNSCTLFKQIWPRFDNKKTWIFPGTLDGKYYKKINIRYEPTFFNDIESLIKRLKEHKVKIVLFTLPSLFDPVQVADNETLTIGHLSNHIRNAYVYGYMAYRYNDYIRQLALKEGVYCIDLEQYADKNMQPKKKHFFDSYHLIPSAQMELGYYIAEELVRLHVVD